VIVREWQRVDPRFLDDEEQRLWATIAGRQIRFDERASFVQKLTEGRASKGALETFLSTAAAENPNRRLRMMALQDRVSMRVERADFDDLVTLVTQAPTWEKERLHGIRVLLRAISESKPDAPDQILARWTWRLARATRKVQDRRASSEFPEAKRLLGALANSRGHRHEENAQRLVRMAKEQPLPVGVALLASAEGYTPRATKLIEDAREEIGDIREVALALGDNLPAPKQQASRNRRRRRRKKKPTDAAVATESTTETSGETATEDAEKPKRRRRRRKPASGEEGESDGVEQNDDGERKAEPAAEPKNAGEQDGGADAEAKPRAKRPSRTRSKKEAPADGDGERQQDGEHDAGGSGAPEAVAD